MSAIDKSIMNPIENLVGNLPGGGYPAVRAGYGAALGAGIVFGIKPALMFNKDGSERPWIVFEPKNKDSTVFPWWAAVALPAVLFGVFI